MTHGGGKLPGMYLQGSVTCGIGAGNAMEIHELAASEGSLNTLHTDLLYICRCRRALM